MEGSLRVGTAQVETAWRVSLHVHATEDGKPRQNALRIKRSAANNRARLALLDKSADKRLLGVVRTKVRTQREAIFSEESRERELRLITDAPPIRSCEN